MPRILHCQRCGATMAVRRTVCGRCGHLLTFADEEGDVTTSAAYNRRRMWVSGLRIAALGLAVAGGAAAVLVAARGLQPARSGTVVSLRDTLDAVREDSGEEFIAVPPAPAGEADAAAAGLAAYQAGNLDAAVTLHRQATQRHPDAASLHNNLGQILVRLDRPAEAIPPLERAVALEPAQALYRFNLATALGRAGDDERALREWQRLAAEGPRDARVFHNMGMVLRRMLRTEEAVAAFRRATDLAPTEAPAWRGLALGLDAMGSRTEAISAFEQYLALDPDAPDADDVRARVAQLQAPAPPER